MSGDRALCRVDVPGLERVDDRDVLVEVNLGAGGRTSRSRNG